MAVPTSVGLKMPPVRSSSNRSFKLKHSFSSALGSMRPRWMITVGVPQKNARMRWLFMDRYVNS